MVLTGDRPRLAPAIVVPDEQSWAIVGRDPATLGAEPVFDPGAARLLLLPGRVPAGLAGPLAALLEAAPADLPRRTADVAVGAADHGADRGDRGRGDHDEHVDHASHADHGDMMAIVGDPSEDGLVMESIGLRFGPLGTPLPGGLVAEAELDGDVVRDAVVRTQPRAPDAPDPLAPVASAVASAAPWGPRGERRWRMLAALELERAVSHVAWLRALGRIIGWRQLVETCTAALGWLPAGPGSLLGRDPFAAPAPEALDGLVRLARGARMRLRTEGVARITEADARRRGLSGPIARASGISDDARAGDEAYGVLGFEPVVRSEGDAFARAAVRAEEARAALELAGPALARAAADRGAGAARRAGGRSRPGPVAVEGPRGPLVAERAVAGWRLRAPGARAAREAAGEAMAGREWAAALVALASFDLSPAGADG